jgi:hypothetical protein
MRLFLIALIGVGIIFVGIIGFVDSVEQPPARGHEDDYQPSPFFSSLGNIASLYPGATYVLPDPNPFTVGPNPRVFTIPRTDSTQTRLVKLALRAGSSALVTYNCAGANCSKSLCLVPAAGVSQPGCLGKPRDTGAIPLDPAGGTIEVKALSPQTAMVESR